MSELLSWERCTELVERVFEALDWAALGKLYFHRDGEQELLARRDDIISMGLDQARALLPRLTPKGRSLHVGAGLAELPVMIAEVTVRGRKVRPVNRRVRECELLNATLKRHQLGKSVVLQVIDGKVAAEGNDYDHLGCVSLFTDPETWPTLSGVAYGRIAPVQVDVERFVAEREEAYALAEALFNGLTRPGWITTTAEELPWFLEVAGRQEIAIEPDDEILPTAVVGDPIGFARVG